MIDLHTHFFSRPFFDTLAALSPQPGTNEEKLAAATKKAGIELPDADVDAHLARWLGEMDKHGVEHMVTFASLPEEVPAVLSATSKSGGKLTPFAIVNPTADGAKDKVAALLGQKGVKGLLLFPAMHKYDPSGDAALSVLEVANQHSAFAIVHCGLLHVKFRDLLGIPRPFDYRFANPLNLVPAANRCRNVKFVIPHFGAGMLRETLMVGSECENVHVDTSSSNAWMATQEQPTELKTVLARALGVFGADRVLFGTDSSTFPRGWNRAIYEAQKTALETLGTSAADQAKVFGGNAKRLLGL
ncbi:MAG: amidohydrolase [Planctomycetes bacterium]|nr:amidohydrolase [Planctomycetota bacterium]